MDKREPENSSLTGLPRPGVQQRRYARQLALPDIGEEGQRKLAEGSVLVIGAGGLGSPALLYLAGAGIGRIGVVDADRLDLSNLQRQVIHATPDLDRNKAESARERIAALNPEVTVEAHPVRFDRNTAGPLLSRYDFVLDCTDNFDSKFFIADACHRANRPYCHAGILRHDGQLLTVIPGKTACYRCVFEAPPPEASAPVAGPMGYVPGVIGTLEAAEAIRYLLGIGRLLTNRLLVFRSLEMTFRLIPLQRNPDCPLCGQEPPSDGASDDRTGNSDKRTQGEKR
jgi:molybdopterin-synthase adenylyltransferase